VAERSGESGLAAAVSGHVIAVGVVQACAVARAVEPVAAGGTGVLARRAHPARRADASTCSQMQTNAGQKKLKIIQK